MKRKHSNMNIDLCATYGFLLLGPPAGAHWYAMGSCSCAIRRDKLFLQVLILLRAGIGGACLGDRQGHPLMEHDQPSQHGQLMKGGGILDRCQGPVLCKKGFTDCL